MDLRTAQVNAKPFYSWPNSLQHPSMSLSFARASTCQSLKMLLPDYSLELQFFGCRELRAPVPVQHHPHDLMLDFEFLSWLKISLPSKASVQANT